MYTCSVASPSSTTFLTAFVAAANAYALLVVFAVKIVSEFANEVFALWFETAVMLSV